MTTDLRIDAYIAEQAQFARPILTHLRDRIHTECPEIGETIKWGRPFFTFRGRPLANMAAFKAHASFGFWDRNARAGSDEGGGMGQFGRLRTINDLPNDETLDAMIREAVALAERKDRPKRAARPAKPEPEVPEELAVALTHDAAAAASFAAFSSSCRREYCDWIAAAKRPETRKKRVAEAIDWLRAGKRRNWKYENC